MLTQKIRIAALAVAAGGLVAASPVAALPSAHASAWATAAPVYGDMAANYGDRGRHRGWYKQDRRDRYDRYDRYDSGYRQPVYRGSTWRGDDGRYYCRKSDGTTGLIVGGAAGALLGREIAGRNGDRTLGAILGAAGGALLGKSIDSKVTCR